MSNTHETAASGPVTYELGLAAVTVSQMTINDWLKVVDLQFDSRQETALHMAENAVDIIETNTTFGEASIPAPPDRERKGLAYRKGNFEGKDFMEAFGFRGVEFGNWNNQDDRKVLLNDMLEISFC
ncbi:MAG: hypothetical protein Q7T74_06420 [Candidatus Saccharibacteria bacterium]|nr:hypothetical protein [Candidatus Saccharibacteria bacterium]